MRNSAAVSSLLSFQAGRAGWIGAAIRTRCDLDYGKAVLVHFQLRKGRNGELGGFVYNYRRNRAAVSPNNNGDIARRFRLPFPSKPVGRGGLEWLSKHVAVWVAGCLFCPIFSFERVETANAAVSSKTKDEIARRPRLAIMTKLRGCSVFPFQPVGWDGLGRLSKQVAIWVIGWWCWPIFSRERVGAANAAASSKTKAEIARWLSLKIRPQPRGGFV